MSFINNIFCLINLHNLDSNCKCKNCGKEIHLADKPKVKFDWILMKTSLLVDILLLNANDVVKYVKVKRINKGRFRWFDVGNQTKVVTN